MAKVEGLNKVVDALRKRAAKAKKDERASVIVGYTAAYALWVHESVGMKLKGQPRGAWKLRYSRDKGWRQTSKRGFYWDPQGQAQAKFLEGPARELAPELGRIVAQALLKGLTMSEALLIAGLRLQRESQLLVPVETGALKASAFTRLEN